MSNRRKYTSTIVCMLQMVMAKKAGLYQQINTTQESMSVQEYKELAESERYNPPTSLDHKDLERKYWKKIIYLPPIYGADISGSLTDSDEHVSDCRPLLFLMLLTLGEYHS